MRLKKESEKRGGVKGEGLATPGERVNILNNKF
jgi:hypothetical protein